MLHGFTSSPAVFRFLVPLLKNYDAIISPVLPGHTGNLDDFQKVTVRDWLYAVEISYEKLQKEYKEVDVLGLSLGGLLACHLGQHYPIHHLYLLAPALDLCMNLPFTLSLLKCLRSLGFRQFRGSGGNLFSNQHAEITLRRLAIDTTIELLTWIQSFRQILPSCPIDLFLGEHDKVVDSRKVAERFIPASQLHIHWLKNSAHVLPLDSDVQIIAEAINNSSQDF
jgi:carboxylesterase